MKKLNSRVIAFAGVLIAMNIILSRVVAINIGSSLRITVSATPIYLAGFWFGPLVGGICGGLSDLLGCLVSGYAPNPLILVSSVLTGVLPGLLKGFVTRKPDIFRFFGVVALHGIVGSLGFATFGLRLYTGMPWAVLYSTRAVQTLLLTAVNSMLVFALYRSPLTGIVTKSMSQIRGKAPETVKR